MFDHYKSFAADEARPTFETILLFLTVLFYKPGPQKVVKQSVNISHRIS